MLVKSLLISAVAFAMVTTTSASPLMRRNEGGLFCPAAPRRNRVCGHATPGNGPPANCPPDLPYCNRRGKCSNKPQHQSKQQCSGTTQIVQGGSPLFDEFQVQVIDGFTNAADVDEMNRRLTRSGRGFNVALIKNYCPGSSTALCVTDVLVGFQRKYAGIGGPNIDIIANQDSSRFDITPLGALQMKNGLSYGGGYEIKVSDPEIDGPFHVVRVFGEPGDLAVTVVRNPEIPEPSNNDDGVFVGIGQTTSFTNGYYQPKADAFGYA